VTQPGFSFPVLDLARAIRKGAFLKHIETRKVHGYVCSYWHPRITLLPASSCRCDRHDYGYFRPANV